MRRTAVVTGASSGIGAATVAAMEKAKYRVHGLSRSNGVDVASPVVIGHRLRKIGSVDVLVVSAGVGFYGPIASHRGIQNREMVETNVLGFINTIQAALPYLLKSEAADVVGVTSTAGLSVTGNSATYTATKHAQVAYLKALDAEYGSPEFRVTNIAPGNVATNFAVGAGRTEGMPQLDDMLRPEDVAREIVRVVQLPREQRADTVVIRPTRRFRA